MKTMKTTKSMKTVKTVKTMKTMRVTTMKTMRETMMSIRESMMSESGESGGGSLGCHGHGGGGKGHRGSDSYRGNLWDDSPGLVQGLVVGGPGFNDRLGSEDGLVLNDGLRNVLGGNQLSGSNMSNGRRLMDHGGLSNRVSDGRNLRSGLSISMSLSNGIGEVATKTVVLNGG